MNAYTAPGRVARPTAKVEDAAQERAIRVVTAAVLSFNPNEITGFLTNGGGFPDRVEEYLADSLRHQEMSDYVDVLRAALEG